VIGMVTDVGTGVGAGLTSCARAETTKNRTNTVAGNRMGRL
jgi:hypothetical protein